MILGGVSLHLDHSLVHWWWDKKGGGWEPGKIWGGRCTGGGGVKQLGIRFLKGQGNYTTMLNIWNLKSAKRRKPRKKRVRAGEALCARYRRNGRYWSRGLTPSPLSLSPVLNKIMQKSLLWSIKDLECISYFSKALCRKAGSNSRMTLPHYFFNQRECYVLQVMGWYTCYIQWW